MKVCAAGYPLTYVTNLKLQLFSRTVIGLTAAKFKPLILPKHGFPMSNNKYIWIYVV
jgi:hypothetical protein